MHISRKITFLRSNLNYITFFNHSEQLYCLAHRRSFFIKGFFIFAIFSVIALNFPKSNVQSNFFQNILKKIGNVLRIFQFIIFVLIIWQVNAFWMTVFFIAIVTMFFLALVFIVFTALFFSTLIKLSYCMLSKYSHIFELSFVIVFCVLFLGFFIISYLGFSFFLSLHCSCIFLLTFYMIFICLLFLTIINHQQVLLFLMLMLILTKMLIAFKVIITPLRKSYGYFYQPHFYF